MFQSDVEFTLRFGNYEIKTKKSIKTLISLIRLHAEILEEKNTA